MVNRVPPQNIDAEQAVLGSCMLDQDLALKCIEIIPNYDAFYSNANKLIYKAIIKLIENNEKVDLLTLSNSLKNIKKFDDIGGPLYLTSLLDIIPTTDNVIFYANIVKEKYIRRKIIESGANLVDMAFVEDKDTDIILDNAQSLLFNISQEITANDFAGLNNIIKDNYKKIEILYEQKKNISGIPTGFFSLDKLTSGLQNSDLIVLAARPGMGKTALALNIANNIALFGYKIGIFSLEMSKEQLTNRLLSNRSYIFSDRLKNGRLRENDWQNIAKTMNIISQEQEDNIFIDDTASITVLEMRSKAMRLKKNNGLDLLIIDYIQLINGKDKNDNRVNEISRITRQLKCLAKELNIPVIALSQLSRAVETRENKRPILSDLRDSGDIEANADAVYFIHRHSYYTRETDNKPKDFVSEVLISKQRNGGLGSVLLGFLGEYTKFVNLEQVL